MKLPKSARLHHRSLQEKLFLEGNKLHEYPLKLIWRALSEEDLERNFRASVPDLIGPLQVLVSVPKKKRRRAVDRVLMRRRIREAFRRGRGPLLDVIATLPEVRTVSVGLVYMKESNVKYAEISGKLEKLLEKLGNKLKEQNGSQANEPADKITDTAG